jgi:adenine-specific DNA methylase
MFNARQLLTLLTFGQQIRLVRDLLSAQDADCARAVALFLSIVVSRYITRSCAMTVWDPGTNKNSSIFARHDIQMTWDHSEVNPFSGSAGSWESQLNAFLHSLENLAAVGGQPSAVVRLGSATHMPAEGTDTFDAVITDPPYYDSVTYADLSDFFYPWHKRIVGDDYPEAFVTEVTPKDEELVQEAIYHGGSKASAKQFYEDGMAAAFAEMHRVLRPDGIAVIMFAHKQSSAWETLVSALIRAGFQITASWPLNTEGRRLQSYRAVALASSVYLVCRSVRAADRRISGSANQRISESPPPPLSPSPPPPRPRLPSTVYRLPFCGLPRRPQSPLRTTIRRYLERFWAAGIGGRISL